MISFLNFCKLISLSLSLMQNTSGDKTREVQLSVREALSSKKEEPKKDSKPEFPNFIDHSDDDEASFDAKMRQKILRRRKDLGDVPPKQKMHNGTLIICVIFQVINSNSIGVQLINTVLYRPSIRNK